MNLLSDNRCNKYFHRCSFRSQRDCTTFRWGVLFLRDISGLPWAHHKDVLVLKEAATREGLYCVRERLWRIADVAISHCYVTIVVPYGKSTPLPPLRLTFRPCSRFINLSRPFGRGASFVLSSSNPTLLSRVKCMRWKKCACIRYEQRSRVFGENRDDVCRSKCASLELFVGVDMRHNMTLTQPQIFAFLGPR